MVESIISNSISTLGMRVLRMRYYIVTLMCVVAAAGCSREENSPDLPFAAKVELDLASRPATRAHFDDNGHFVWDADGSMIAVISRGWTNSNAGALVKWNSSEWCSPMNITQLDPSNSSRVLRATSASTLATDAAASGDGLFCFSPVVGSSNATLTQSDSEVAVEFSMPREFSQSASGKLEEFGDYCFIHGESTIASAPTGAQKNFTASPTTFYAIPATIRFNIKNNTDAAVRMESVKITCNKLFPDKLCWKSSGGTPVISEPEHKSGYFHTIKTAIDEGFGEEIPAKVGENLSTGTYYALCLPFDDAASLSDATLAFILESKEKIHTFNISAAEFFKSVLPPAEKKFESNKIYTLNFTLNDNSVELESVTISDWVGEPFYLPTEDVTARIKVNVTYWIQERHNLYTFEFMQIFEDTQWGLCNIGEYMETSTEQLFLWKEVTPVNNSDEDYLAPFFNNITDFKWKTPTRADFDKLFSLPEKNIIMEFDKASGVYGLRFKSVTTPGASIFLPCSKKEEHTNYDENQKFKTSITRRLHGYYWTRDASENSDEKAYLLHFSFQHTERYIDDILDSTTPFIPAINNGTSLYRFADTTKNIMFPVRAIL